MIDNSNPTQSMDLLAKHDTENVTKAIAALEQRRRSYRIIVIILYVYSGIALVMIPLLHYFFWMLTDTGRVGITARDRLIFNAETLLLFALVLGMTLWIIWIQRKGPAIIRQQLENSGLAQRIAMGQLNTEGLVQSFIPKFSIIIKGIRNPSFKNQLVVAVTYLRWFLRPTSKYIPPEVYFLVFYAILIPYQESIIYSIRSAYAIGLPNATSEVDPENWTVGNSIIAVIWM